MILNPNSWHAKLYTFMYRREYEYKGILPSNLCPYFWKVVLGVIFVVPAFIFQLPTYFISAYDRHSMSSAVQRLIGVVLYICIALFIGVLIMFWHALLALFGAYSYDSYLASIGAIVFFISGAVLLFIVIHKSSHTIGRKLRLTNEEGQNVIVEYWKGVYNKNCPSIDWGGKRNR